MFKKSIILGSFVLCMSAAAPANAAIVVANSVTDFSGTQGHQGWYYGYVTPSTPSYTFTQMTEFDGARWWVNSSSYWTMLGPVGAHSNGVISSGTAMHQEQWAARRWVSSVEGAVDVDAVLRKLNTNEAGNGITARIYLDGVEVWNQFLNATDSIGVTPSLEFEVTYGTMIDFVLDPFQSNDWSDNTQFSIKVTSVPAPAAAGLLGVVGLTSITRRRRK